MPSTQKGGEPKYSITEGDKRRIIDTLHLWKPGTLRIKTSDDIEKLRGWYEGTLEGVTFGEEWADYSVRYVGVSWWPAHPIGFTILNASASGVPTPKQPDVPVLLCGVCIHNKRSRAFAEILFRGYGDGFEPLESIQNTQFCKSEREMIDVWRGFDLFKYLQKTRGPSRLLKNESFATKTQRHEGAQSRQHTAFTDLV